MPNHDVFWEAKEKMRKWDADTSGAGLLQKQTAAKALKVAAAASKDTERRGLYLKMLKELTDSPPAVFGGIRLSLEDKQNLTDKKHDIEKAYHEELLERAKALLYLKGGKIRLLDRQQLLEKAIKMIQPLCDATDADELDISKRARILAAKCYLARSRSVLPHGLKAPPKKLESLRMIRRMIEPIGAAEKLMALSYLEEEKAAPGTISEAVIKPLLEKVIPKLDQADAKTHDDWLLIAGAARYGVIADCLLDIPQTTTQLALLHVKALVHLRASDREGIKEAIKVTIAQLKEEGLHFGSGLWDELVKLLWELNKEHDWQLAELAELAEETLDVCRQIEDEMKLPADIRVRWSRLYDLYRLAFLCAKETHDAAGAISAADSLKSRPALKRGALEETMTPAQLQFLIEREARQAGGEFIEDRSTLIRYVKTSGSKERTETIPTFPKIQRDWAYVHFYLADSGEGYTVTFHSDRDPEFRDFAWPKVWGKYSDWIRTYTLMQDDSKKKPYKDVMEGKLIELCRAMGEELPFLFDPQITPEKHLLFIPHGFVHRLPLHAACNSAGNYLFQDKISVYLPAARMADFSTTPDPEMEKNIAIFIYLGKDNEMAAGFKRIFEPFNLKSYDVSPNELTEKLKTFESPGVIAIACHGKANLNNPYFSRLILHGGPLTYAKLEEELSGKSFKGSGVVLAACESEMTGFHYHHQTDEHLSLALPFLMRKASYVVGGLWEVDFREQGPLVEQILREPQTPHIALNTLQKTWLKENISLSRLAPFRILAGKLGEDAETKGETND